MGKWCDPLESGMCTCMCAKGFCLIWSNTTMWNIYDRERSTWMKLIKLHTKSRESAWGSRFVVKCSSHQSNLLDPDQKCDLNGLGALVQREKVPLESPSSIGFTVFAHAHGLNDWTLLCRCENMCPEHYVGIVLSSQWKIHCSTR